VTFDGMQALDLLKKNLDNANAGLGAIVEDLQFLRDQVTITEVFIFNLLL
jgi:hypothetical protein